MNSIPSFHWATGGHYITMPPADWSISTSHDPFALQILRQKISWNLSIAALTTSSTKGFRISWWACAFYRITFMPYTTTSLHGAETNPGLITSVLLGAHWLPGWPKVHTGTASSLGLWCAVGKMAASQWVWCSVKFSALCARLCIPLFYMFVRWWWLCIELAISCAYDRYCPVHCSP